MSGLPDSGYSRTLICQAKADLISVAATIDRLYDPSSPSLELLEVERAIHNALVALDAWGGTGNHMLVHAVG